ncbi:MAG: phosphatidate cytidylyltransferase, partial [Candidatus Methylomirabilis sp.]|nr:phosphatidate cytidylyltransferase [Deltaproteobacteria bacterium]
MLAKRLATGFALAAFAIVVVIWAPYWFVTLVVMAIAGVCLSEYVGMTMAKDAPVDRHLTMGLGLATVASMSGGAAGASAGLSLALVASAAHTLFRFGTIEEAPSKLAVRWTGIVYCGFFFGHYLLLRPHAHGWELILTTFVASFLGDTAAYFAGRRFGKTPLYAAV